MFISTLADSPTCLTIHCSWKLAWKKKSKTMTAMMVKVAATVAAGQQHNKSATIFGISF